MTVRLSASGVRIARGRRDAVRSVSMEMRGGELWALVGPNGSGKSTLLEGFVGCAPLAAGRVELGGTALSAIPRLERARRLAWVGRELGRDLPLSVRGLVELGRLPYLPPFGPLAAEDEAMVDRALRRAGCEALAERPLFALSDGERQRAHVARAFAQDPEVLLLDEATAHLDLAHREETLHHLLNFTRGGGAALVVLHDLDLAVRYCDRLAVLNDGELVASGRPDLVLDRNVLDGVFGVDAAVVHDSRGPMLRVYGARRTRLERKEAS